MKKILLSAVSLAILSGSALAADLPSRKAPVAPPPPPPPMWTGFYAGLNLGGGWSGGNGNSNAYNLDGLNGGITNNIGSNGNSGGVLGGAAGDLAAAGIGRFGRSEFAGRWRSNFDRIRANRAEFAAYGGAYLGSGARSAHFGWGAYRESRPLATSSRPAVSTARTTSIVW